MLDEVTTGTMIMRKALSMIALHGCEEDAEIAERGLAGHIDQAPSKVSFVLGAVMFVLAGILIGRLL